MGPEEILRAWAMVLQPLSKDLDPNFRKSRSPWFHWGFIFESSGGVTIWKLLCSWNATWVIGCSSQWEQWLLVWPWWEKCPGCWDSFLLGWTTQMCWGGKRRKHTKSARSAEPMWADVRGRAPSYFNQTRNQGLKDRRHNDPAFGGMTQRSVGPHL